MYFPEHPLNKIDLLLKRKSPVEQNSMIAKRIKTDPETYSYNIILQKAWEISFFDLISHALLY